MLLDVDDYFLVGHDDDDLHDGHDDAFVLLSSCFVLLL
jgi:hypothetical protein